MKTTRELTDEQVLRFLRFGNAGFTSFAEVSYDTQLSIERGVIWLIHAVEWVSNASFDTPAASTTEYLTAQITRESKTAIVNANDSDLIAIYDERLTRGAAIGTDAGPVVTHFLNPHIQYFDPPIPYAGSNIYIGAECSIAAGTIRGRIHFSLITVTDKYFFRVASALVS